MQSNPNCPIQFQTIGANVVHAHTITSSIIFKKVYNCRLLSVAATAVLNVAIYVCPLFLWSVKNKFQEVF